MGKDILIMENAEWKKRNWWDEWVKV